MVVEGGGAYAPRGKQFRVTGVEGQVSNYTLKVMGICYSKISHYGTWAYSEVKATQNQQMQEEFSALTVSIQTQPINLPCEGVSLSLTRNRRATLITREWVLR